jgi:hypothetical protein
VSKSFVQNERKIKNGKEEYQRGNGALSGMMVIYCPHIEAHILAPSNFCPFHFVHITKICLQFSTLTFSIYRFLAHSFGQLDWNGRLRATIILQFPHSFIHFPSLSVQAKMAPPGPNTKDRE